MIMSTPLISILWYFHSIIHVFSLLLPVAVAVQRFQHDHTAVAKATIPEELVGISIL